MRHYFLIVALGEIFYGIVLGKNSLLDGKNPNRGNLQLNNPGTAKDEIYDPDLHKDDSSFFRTQNKGNDFETRDEKNFQYISDDSDNEGSRARTKSTKVIEKKKKHPNFGAEFKSSFDTESIFSSESGGKTRVRRSDQFSDASARANANSSKRKRRRRRGPGGRIGKRRRKTTTAPYNPNPTNTEDLNKHIEIPKDYPGFSYPPNFFGDMFEGLNSNISPLQIATENTLSGKEDIILPNENSQSEISDDNIDKEVPKGFIEDFETGLNNPLPPLDTDNSKVQDTILPDKTSQADDNKAIFEGIIQDFFSGLNDTPPEQEKIAGTTAPSSSLNSDNFKTKSKFHPSSFQKRRIKKRLKKFSTTTSTQVPETTNAVTTDSYEEILSLLDPAAPSNNENLKPKNDFVRPSLARHGLERRKEFNIHPPPGIRKPERNRDFNGHPLRKKPSLERRRQFRRPIPMLISNSEIVHRPGFRRLGMFRRITTTQTPMLTSETPNEVTSNVYEDISSSIAPTAYPLGSEKLKPSSDFVHSSFQTKTKRPRMKRRRRLRKTTTTQTPMITSETPKEITTKINEVTLSPVTNLSTSFSISGFLENKTLDNDNSGLFESTPVTETTKEEKSSDETKDENIEEDSSENDSAFPNQQEETFTDANYKIFYTQKYSDDNPFYKNESEEIVTVIRNTTNGSPKEVRLLIPEKDIENISRSHGNHPNNLHNVRRDIRLRRRPGMPGYRNQPGKRYLNRKNWPNYYNKIQNSPNERESPHSSRTQNSYNRYISQGQESVGPPTQYNRGPNMDSLQGVPNSRRIYISRGKDNAVHPDEDETGPNFGFNQGAPSDSKLEDFEEPSVESSSDLMPSLGGILSSLIEGFENLFPGKAKISEETKEEFKEDEVGDRPMKADDEVDLENNFDNLMPDKEINHQFTTNPLLNTVTNSNIAPEDTSPERILFPQDFQDYSQSNYNSNRRQDTNVPADNSRSAGSHLERDEFDRTIQRPKFPNKRRKIRRRKKKPTTESPVALNNSSDFSFPNGFLSDLFSLLWSNDNDTETTEAQSTEVPPIKVTSPVSQTSSISSETISTSETKSFDFTQKPSILEEKSSTILSSTEMSASTENEKISLSTPITTSSVSTESSLTSDSNIPISTEAEPTTKTTPSTTSNNEISLETTEKDVSSAVIPSTSTELPSSSTIVTSTISSSTSDRPSSRTSANTVTEIPSTTVEPSTSPEKPPSSAMPSTEIPSTTVEPSTSPEIAPSSTVPSTKILSSFENSSPNNILETSTTTPEISMISTSTETPSTEISSEASLVSSTPTSISEVSSVSPQSFDSLSKVIPAEIVSTSTESPTLSTQISTEEMFISTTVELLSSTPLSSTETSTLSSTETSSLSSTETSTLSSTEKSTLKTSVIPSNPVILTEISSASTDEASISTQSSTDAARLSISTDTATNPIAISSSSIAPTDPSLFTTESTSVLTSTSTFPITTEAASTVTKSNLTTLETTSSPIESTKSYLSTAETTISSILSSTQEISYSTLTSTMIPESTTEIEDTISTEHKITETPEMSTRLSSTKNVEEEKRTTISLNSSTTPENLSIVEEHTNDSSFTTNADTIREINGNPSTETMNSDEMSNPPANAMANASGAMANANAGSAMANANAGSAIANANANAGEAMANAGDTDTEANKKPSTDTMNNDENSNPSENSMANSGSAMTNTNTGDTITNTNEGNIDRDKNGNSSNETMDNEEIPNHPVTAIPPPGVRCEENETYYRCVPHCQHMCFNYDSDVPCMPDFCEPGCFCSPGLVINENGRCVAIEECYQEACGIDEEWWDCKPECHNTCENYARAEACLDTKCVPGCYCRDGLIMDTDGSCVEPEECADPICLNHEEETDCMSPCNTCVANCHSCKFLMCRSGCDCKDGYKRNAKGECILAAQCPKCEIPSSEAYANATEVA